MNLVRAEPHRVSTLQAFGEYLLLAQKRMFYAGTRFFFTVDLMKGMANGGGRSGCFFDMYYFPCSNFSFLLFYDAHAPSSISA